MSKISTAKKIVRNKPKWAKLPIMIMNTNGDVKSIDSCPVFKSKDSNNKPILVIDPT